MGRHLICLIDGTKVSANQTSAYSGYSNVFELAYMLQLKDKSEDLRPQIVFYTSGISSQPDTKDLFSSATGRAIRSQILDQYTNLCSNYDFELHSDAALRDKIYLFGFSRGAMAARAVAGLIMEYGLLRPEHVRYAPKIVDDWERRNSRPNYVDLVEVAVDFLGVFDSVMGGIQRMRMFNPIKFPHERLSGRCVTGIHLLAIDEDRALFRNRSWESHDRAELGMMRQIWVPGVHSDIGGTASEFWGRISLLTMTHYIDRMTPLKLDDAWLEKKQRAVCSDFRDQAYRVEQHRPLYPLATKRVPRGTPAANEELHPIVRLLPENIEYNNDRSFLWQEKYFRSGFGDLPRDSELEEYFQRILAA